LQYLVMELVEGESLRAMIKRNGPMIPTSAAEILSQACSALDEAHRHGIVHRDIKPDNIFVSRTVGGLRVKVLDFGIAKLKDPVATNLTLTGSVMGTPHYMSPEQCLGEELDHRSDIYSLGIVTYEMLTGRVPFNSPTSTAVVIQHVNHPPPALHLIRSDITPAIESVVLHALEKRREMRPQSAGALASEFTAAVNGVPTINRPAHSYETPVSMPAQSAEPTLVLRNPTPTPQYAPQYISGPMPQAQPAFSQPPPFNTAKTVILTAVATILLVSLGGIIAWMATADSRDSGRSETSNNANRRTQTNTRANENTASSTPTQSTNTNMAAVNTNTAATPVDNSVARTQEVMAFMNRWADSLKRRDVYDNLSLYADYLNTFYSEVNISKDRVRYYREQSFKRYYSSVDVQLTNVQVSFDYSGSTVTVTYTNTYDWRGRSSYLNGKSDNEMTLSKTSGQWLITSEKHVYSYYENRGP
ncbi:MAG: protein kinase, partial [Acidobacteria bacterium]|nr:protein kinase [Acidobacteriota bacterium]